MESPLTSIFPARGPVTFYCSLSSTFFFLCLSALLFFSVAPSSSLCFISSNNISHAADCYAPYLGVIQWQGAHQLSLNIVATASML